MIVESLPAAESLAAPSASPAPARDAIRVQRASVVYPGADAPVRLSTKHTLALTNRGNGTTADLLTLAREVRDGVSARFGVTLVPEPVFVNCRL